MPTTTDASIRLVRHATLLLAAADTTFLVDPMLGAPGDMPPIENTPNQRDNPLVPLPDVDLTYDAVVVTHRHPDHFDEAAKAELADDVPLFCQPEEADAFVEEEFTDVRPVDDETAFEGVTIRRTPGRHGHGELAERMGPVSGFVFEAGASVYLAGDTVWCDDVERTLDSYDLDAVVLNAGAAQFLEGDPITMAEDDVAAVRSSTDATVLAVHMEAINHCLLTREELRSAVDDVLVPDDGEDVRL
ncbi:MBL fold metallo-hydrolase [Halogeometricum limi]|uniref:Beta-lactamase superfamily domain-containing protein n=1 Tax=Halogeometricum limi TaxID=555875 RepID=A0A1I6IDR3_9EURY|nr:MBL fold metallo-hydrolase [Halogeometricum limi]SFR64823.1 Beta-lactamase superfamily domain-containing protein [Halogeometricum limi]